MGGGPISRKTALRNTWMAPSHESGRNIQENTGKMVKVGWDEHVMRRDEEYVGKSHERGCGRELGRRRKGRPKRVWMDSVNVDLREKWLSGEHTHNRGVRIDPHVEVGEKMQHKKKNTVYIYSLCLNLAHQSVNNLACVTPHIWDTCLTQSPKIH